MNNSLLKKMDITNIARQGDCYLVSDRHFIIKVPLDTPVLDSRKRFPMLPEDGEEVRVQSPFKNAKDPKWEVNEKHSLSKMWNELAELEGETLIETSFIYDYGKTLGKVFVFQDGTLGFINREYLDIFELEQCHSVRATSSLSAFAFGRTNNGIYEMVAIVMPMQTPEYLDNRLAELGVKDATT